MTTRVKFKALTHSGKTIFFTEKIDTPDFKTTPETEFLGATLPEIPATAKVIDWLDVQDKTLLMEKRGLKIIFDYWIPKKSKKSSVVDVLKTLDLDDQALIDLGAIYKRIEPSLKGKAIEAKVKILLSHYLIAIQAKTAAFKHIVDFSKEIEAEIIAQKEFEISEQKFLESLYSPAP